MSASLISRADLAELAAGWMLSGATGFEVEIAGATELWPDPVVLEDYVSVPILVQGAISGELRLSGVDEEYVAERLLVQARLIGLLIEARSEVGDVSENLNDFQDRFLAMCDLAVAGADALDAETVLDELVRHGSRLAQVEAVFAYVLDGEDETLVSYPDIIDHVSIKQSLQHVDENNDLVLGQTATMMDGRTESAILCLLKRDGKPMGVLGLVHKLTGEFDGSDAWLALAVASHGTAALERAHAHRTMVGQARLTREYEIAADVQTSLIPHAIPEVSGVELGASYVPSLYVGGDFYDWQPLDDGSLVVTVGDVSGKGMSAALVMSMAQMLTRSAIREDHVDPSELCDAVNANLYEQLVDIGAFITMFFMYYDPDAGTLTYSNAGHSPVVLRVGGDDPVVLDAHGPPLGVLPELGLDTATVPFGPGDMIVACSDGIVEQRNRTEEMFGYDRLLELIDRGATMPGEALASLLLEAVAEFAQGAPVDDDQTIVVLRGPTPE